MSEKPLAAAAERLKGKPGRPRTRPEGTPVVLPPRLLDIVGVATYFCISLSAARNLVSTGLLRRVRLPTRGNGELRKILIDREDLDRFIEAAKEDG